MLTDEQFVSLLMRTARRGSILTLDGDMPFSSNSRHHFVILNHDPQSHEFLVTVNHTSHVADRLTRLHRRGNVDVAATTVVFEPGEYSFFPLQTLFDCNSVHEITEAELLAAYKAGHLTVPNSSVQLTDGDLDKLSRAAINSKNVPPIHKKMIDPNFST